MNAFTNTSFPLLVSRGEVGGIEWQLHVLGPAGLDDRISFRFTRRVPGFGDDGFGDGFETGLMTMDHALMNVSYGNVGGVPILVAEFATNSYGHRLVRHDGTIVFPELIQPGGGLPNFVVAEMRSVPLVVECGVLDKVGNTRVVRQMISGGTPPELHDEPLPSVRTSLVETLMPDDLPPEV